MKNLFSLYLIWLLMYLYVNLNYLFYSLYFIRGFPLWSSGWDSTLAMQVAWVQSLVRELISYMLCNAAKRFFFFLKGLPLWLSWYRICLQHGRPGFDGKGYPLQYSGLENFMDCTAHGVKELDMTKWLSLHFTSMFPSNSFIVFNLTFRSLIYFEFIFVYGVKECSTFILLHVCYVNVITRKALSSTK